MDVRQAFRMGLRRFLLLLAFSLVLVWLGSEAAFIMLKEDTDRPPQQIELVIPAGAAEQVSAGEPLPSIPEKMVFVVGDTLVVKNQDAADHELGPLWIPAGTTARLQLNEPARLAYSCSFQNTRYLGVDVRQPTTWTTRLYALLLAAPATATFLFLYSLALWPLQPRVAP
jgi:hypothetical protein